MSKEADTDFARGGREKEQVDARGVAAELNRSEGNLKIRKSSKKKVFQDNDLLSRWVFA